MGPRLRGDDELGDGENKFEAVRRETPFTLGCATPGGVALIDFSRVEMQTSAIVSPRWISTLMSFIHRASMLAHCATPVAAASASHLRWKLSDDLT
jgi:hypothetical protein